MVSKWLKEMEQEAIEEWEDEHEVEHEHDNWEDDAEYCADDNKIDLRHTNTIENIYLV